jgi:hypothetical protein
VDNHNGCHSQAVPDDLSEVADRQDSQALTGKNRPTKWRNNETRYKLSPQKLTKEK